MLSAERSATRRMPRRALLDITPGKSASHQSVASAFDAMEPDVSGVLRGLVRHAIPPTSAFHRLRRRSSLGRVEWCQAGLVGRYRPVRRVELRLDAVAVVVSLPMPRAHIWHLEAKERAVTVRRRSERPSP